METKTLVCMDCGNEFQFTTKDQEFYQEKGFKAPKRCRTCRDIRKNNDASNGVEQHYDKQSGKQNYRDKKSFDRIERGY